jgi:hypothetical protein
VWLIENNAIWSKDNMIRRGWVGDSSCQFCDIEENISHLFFDALQAESFGGWLLNALVPPMSLLMLVNIGCGLETGCLEVACFTVLD